MDTEVVKIGPVFSGEAVQFPVLKRTLTGELKVRLADDSDDLQFDVVQFGPTFTSFPSIRRSDGKVIPPTIPPSSL